MSLLEQLEKIGKVNQSHKLSFKCLSCPGSEQQSKGRHVYLQILQTTPWANTEALQWTNRQTKHTENKTSLVEIQICGGRKDSNLSQTVGGIADSSEICMLDKRSFCCNLKWHNMSIWSCWHLFKMSLTLDTLSWVQGFWKLMNGACYLLKFLNKINLLHHVASLWCVCFPAFIINLQILITHSWSIAFPCQYRADKRSWIINW